MPIGMFFEVGEKALLFSFSLRLLHFQITFSSCVTRCAAGSALRRRDSESCSGSDSLRAHEAVFLIRAKLSLILPLAKRAILNDRITPIQLVCI